MGRQRKPGRRPVGEERWVEFVAVCRVLGFNRKIWQTDKGYEDHFGPELYSMYRTGWSVGAVAKEHGSEDFRHYYKILREKRRKEGLCICGRKPFPGRKSCKRCLLKGTARSKRYQKRKLQAVSKLFPPYEEKISNE